MKDYKEMATQIADICRDKNISYFDVVKYTEKGLEIAYLDGRTEQIQEDLETINAK